MTASAATTAEVIDVPETTFTVCLLQPALRRDDQSPLDVTRETIVLMHRAIKEEEQSQQGKIDLVLLPELCPVGYSEDSFARFLPNTDHNRALHVAIDEELQSAARHLDCAICYGAMGWNEGKKDSTIRQKVVDRHGNLIASYDKIYVCDYGDCCETRFFKPGHKPCSFTINGWRFGLMVCADMRYPLLAQTLVKHHRIHAVLQPAAFARDCSFRTWKAFRETRAAEAGIYFLANNYAGDYFGQTSMNPPWIDEDHEPQVLETEVGYIIATLCPETLREARTTFPFNRQTMASILPPTLGISENQPANVPH